MSTVSQALIYDDSVTEHGATTLTHLPNDKADQFRNFHRHYRDPALPWSIEVIAKFVELVAMPSGWDGYSARAVERETALFALEILNTTMGPRTPMPHIVPTAEGGIQLEWHEKGIEVELYIAGVYECELWVHDHRTGKEFTRSLTNSFEDLRDPIRQLTLR
jgi:hypothetical protein